MSNQGTGPRRDYIDALRGDAILGGEAVGLEQATGKGAHGVQLFFVVSVLTLMAAGTTVRTVSLPFISTAISTACFASRRCTGCR